ncbi:MAG TPA: DNA polymerase I [Elusimicrobia bacterium]|nr:MAG: DNA polymerase I [Elusimicrobia bacterium GWA2_51_34]HAF94855.1 DNA polymerase I [Elusimicrobiota bacterium]HCE97186.1 DNA polymerase I [Elusimicrobiota bacterium]
MDLQRIFIVDAHAFLHRSYHALPKLTNSKGEEVGALYGFMRLLLKLAREQKPKYLAVCFDSPGQTFRRAISADYKANRPPTDPGLVSQLESARELTAALGFKGVYAAGFEADDLIAALAGKFSKAGVESIIVSGDKDAFQLVGPLIKTWDGSSQIFSGPEAVIKKYGVTPSQLADYFSLTGDASDNVPGVAGIGPKSAAKLINEYGSLAAVISAAKNPELVSKDKALAKVAKDSANAELSRRLIVLDTNAPVQDDFEAFIPAKPDSAVILAMARRLEFRELRAMCGAAGGAGPAGESASLDNSFAGSGFMSLFAAKPENLPPLKKLEEILASAAEMLSVYAFEGGAALGASSGVCLLEKSFFSQSQAALVNAAIKNPAIHKTAFGLKNAMHSLDFKAGESPVNFFELEIAAALLGAGVKKRGPQDLVFEKLGHAPAPEGSREEKLLVCGRLGELAVKLKAELEAAGLWKVYETLELPLTEPVYAMEKTGIMVDRAMLGGLSADFEKKLSAIENEAEALTGEKVNLNSPKQLAFLIYEKLNIQLDEQQRRMFKTKEGLSTGEEALTFIKAAHPVIPKILEFREISKLKSSFVDNLLAAADSGGRVHSTFDATGTATGRFSSSKPNLQNIPVRSEYGQLVRRCFIARDGFSLLSADYSQIDLRVLAHNSLDKALVDAFRSGQDIHLRTASEVFNCAPELVTKEMRGSAKAINFGIVYGQGAQGLARELGISRADGARYINYYFEVYSGVREWIDRTVETAKKDGFVTTFTGRRRTLPELKASNPHIRSFAERAAVNTPIQGGSADIIKKAMIRIWGVIKGSAGVFMLSQVHDELIFEVQDSLLEETAALVKREMENAFPLVVPLKAELKAGKNWRDMSPVP